MHLLHVFILHAALAHHVMASGHALHFAGTVPAGHRMALAVHRVMLAALHVRVGRGHGTRSGVAGVIAIADPVKPSTPEALSALRSEGIRVVMLTGDNRTTAEAVARRIGITEVEADVLPDGKSAVIARLRHEGRIVAMAGDGVNDAPALAAADIGIAMGTGTDVAIESAGITLLKGDLTGIVRARRLSRATMRNIRQNLFFASSTTQPAFPSPPARSIRSPPCCSRRSSRQPRWPCRRSVS